MAKPVLLMIHGLVGSLEYFNPTSRIRAFRVATVDLLGYGEHRDAPQERLSLSVQADHVLGCAKERGSDGLFLAGHSMGGAVAMLAAARRPGPIRGIINIEGNFTSKDAFWSGRIVRQSPDAWAKRFELMRADAAAWLRQCGVEPSEQRLAWAEHILDHQASGTVYSMSKAIVEEAAGEDYLAAIRRVVDSGIEIHLVAGERSAAAWDVPDFVRAAARSYTEIPGAGHLMMLEKPDAFCRAIDRVPVDQTKASD